jgi:hypothetical protein
MGPNFFFSNSKIISFQFCEFMAPKKGMTTNFFSSLGFISVFGSGIQDPGSRMGKNQDPG